MITKDDCMSILVKLDDGQIDKTLINKHLRQLMISNEIPLETLKFISQHRGIEVANFYEMLRIKHNKDKSPLYTNIVREIDDPQTIISTLTSLLTQIALYSRKLATPTSFFQEVRAEEISRVLNTYFKTGDYTNSTVLLKCIKSDLLVLEYIAGRRDLAA